MKSPGIVIGIYFFVLAVAAVAGEVFSAGDTVRLVGDTPLYFKDNTVIRVGRRGERFTVLTAKLLDSRVYLAARNLRGQEIALNVAASEVVLVLPPTSPILGGRVSAETRASAMARIGGKPESEQAVIRGLQYLARVQNPDGSWGTGRKPYVAAMTGFSLLSLLGHGETPDSPEYGLAVKMGVGWILDQGRASEQRLSMEP
jgi:hypothetical protein